MRYERRDWIALCFLGLLAGLTLLKQLDVPLLWQDEAQTAVVARTILDDGIPRGTDGRNFFSQEWGAEYAEDHVWRWHTWLSFYAVAASFALFGETTWAARLPFALCGLATVLLAYPAGRRLWGSRDAGLAAGALLALSVPFLVLSRQCRWYAMAAFFALLGLHAYGRVGPDERRHSVTLFVAATLLFQTHYFYTATLLATLLLHSFWLERERFRRVFLVSAAVTLVNAPWILWFSSIRYGEAYSDVLADVGLSFRLAAQLGSDLCLYFLSPVFLAIPIAIAVLARIRTGHWSAPSPKTRSGVALLVLFCVVTVVALAALSPGGYFRYLTPLAAPVMLLCAAMLDSLARLSRLAALGVFALWLALSPIRDFAYEITHGFEGPIDGIVRFLQKNARPGDRVAITYGDMPLKFYLDLRVIGGLTGEDLSEAEGAEWIILRRHHFPGRHARLRETLKSYVVPGDYVLHQIPYPDTRYENREDPRRHRFRSPPLRDDAVRIFGRSDEARARDRRAATGSG